MEQASCLSAQCVYRQKSPGIFILSKLITLLFSQPHSLTPSTLLAFTCSPSGQSTGTSIPDRHEE